MTAPSPYPPVNSKLRPRLFRSALPFRRFVLVSACCLLAAGAAHSAGTSDATPEQVYQLALEARTARDYRAMLALLRQSGEAGEMEAQEMLGSVLLAGASLYGDAVRADLCEAAYWARRAAMQGSEVGRHQIVVLNSMRELSAGKTACTAKAG